MSYYDDREKAYTELKMRVMDWYNNSKSQELDLERLFMEIALKNKSGQFTVKRLFKLYYCNLKEAGINFEYDETKLKLTKG